MLRVVLFFALVCLGNVRQQVESLVGLQGQALRDVAVGIVSMIDSRGRSALHHAAIAGNLPLTELLIELDPTLLKLEDHDQLIPLRHAERIATEKQSTSHMQIASLLLEKTRGLNWGDEKGWQAIVWSIMAGDIPRIKELLAKGADVLGKLGRIAEQLPRHNAHWAAEQTNDAEIIKIIAEHTPDKYFPAVVDGGHWKIAQEMLARGTDVDARDGSQFSAMMRIARAGRLDDFLKLREYGAKIDSATLASAVSSGNTELVEEILNHDRELADDLVSDIALGLIKWGRPRTEVDSIINTVEGTGKIHELLKKAWDQTPPLATINRLRRLGIKNFRSSSNVVLIARNEGLKKEMLEILDYYKGKRRLLPMVMETLNTQPVYKKYAEILLDYLVDEVREPHHRSYLPDLLRIALIVKHRPLIKAVLGNLGDDADFIFPELSRGLALANKDDELSQLIVESSVDAGIDKNRLLKHAKLLEQFDSGSLRYLKDPDGHALLQALRQKDLKAIRGLAEQGVTFTNSAPRISDLIVRDLDLFELLVVDLKLVPIDIGYSPYTVNNRLWWGLLARATIARNLPVIKRIISLGGRVGIDKALLNASGINIVNNRQGYNYAKAKGIEPQAIAGFDPNKVTTKSQFAEYNDEQLTTMKLLVEAGADVNATEETFILEKDPFISSPLTKAIASLQAPRVEFLLEQGAYRGSIKFALQSAEIFVEEYSGPDYKTFEFQKNLDKIKRMLADKGLM